MQVAEMSLKSIRSELLPTLNVYGFYAGAGIAGPINPNCNLAAAECASDLPTGFGSMFENTFNYSSPEYQFGMNLSDQSSQPRCQGRSVSSLAGIQAAPDHLRRAKEEHSLRRAQLAVRAAAGAGSRRCGYKGSRSGTTYLRCHRAGATTRSQVQLAIRWPRSTICPLPNPFLWLRRQLTKRRRWTSTGPPERHWNKPEFRSTMRKWESCRVSRESMEPSVFWRNPAHPEWGSRAGPAYIGYHAGGS